MPSIGGAVVEWMNGQAGTNDLLAGRIYPADAVPDDAAVPYAEYVVIRDDEDRSLEGRLQAYFAEVVISFIADTYRNAQTLQRRGREVLRTMTGQVFNKTIFAASIEDASDTPSGPVARDDQQVFQADLTVAISYWE